MGRAKRVAPTRLGDKLLQIRKSFKLQQIQMIDCLGPGGLYQAHISGFELGSREPPLHILLRYARVAGVCLDVLVDDKLDLPEKLPVKSSRDRAKAGRKSDTRKAKTAAHPKQQNS